MLDNSRHCRQSGSWLRYAMALGLSVTLFMGPATRAVADEHRAAHALAWEALSAPGPLDTFEASLQPAMLEVCHPLTVADAVRTEMMVHSRTLSHPEAMRVADRMTREARRENIDPLLLLAIVAVESSYNHLAISPVGAEGLMQLMPGTAEFLAARGKIAWRDNHTFAPELNVLLGARYLGELDHMFHGDLDSMLTAYNRGPAATRALLRQHRGCLPRAVTRSYAQRVLSHYSALRADYAHLAAG